MSPRPALSDILTGSTLEAVRAIKTHDVIVVGAGAAGGLAAMLAAEAGLRVLVLDAGMPKSPLRWPVRQLTGKMVRQLSGPTLIGLLGPTVLGKARGGLKLIAKWRQPIQSSCFAWERAPDAFVDDVDCPYVTPPDHPFVWLRARVLGGRMVIPGHGRQYYRLGPNDFAPVDGLSPPWPLRPGELDPWYELVERRLGIAGARDHLPWLPDSELTHLLEPTPSEAALKRAITARWPGARPVQGRFAPPLDTLEIAARTGRLLCRQGAVVRQIEVDDSGHVRGVTWIDQRNGSEQRASAQRVFLCASALESTRLLLLSRSSRCPDGLGASSGVLGRNLMDHIMVWAAGSGPPLLPGPPPEDGRCIYLPRFDARELSAPGPGRGFGVQAYQAPAGANWSYFTFVSFGEMVPRAENRVTLDPERRDAWGIRALRIDCTHSDEELVRARDQTAALRALAEINNVKLASINEKPAPPGSAIHECGTARMGSDPANSVLDAHNQCWDAKGLYVTDSASFPSQGTQSPTLTALALTARACDHAFRSPA